MASNSQPEKATEGEPEIYALTRGPFIDWLQRLPHPVLALGKQRLFSVQVSGTGFRLDDGTSTPITGFSTTRIVSASDSGAAAERGMARVAYDWDEWLWREMAGDAQLDVTRVHAVKGRWRWRSGGGFTFYGCS
jgi:hypothetical protein